MKYLYFLTLLFLTFSCQEKVAEPPLNVGDIVFDEKIDDPDFKLCNENLIKQYYVRYSSDVPSGYKGEKAAIVDVFSRKYNCPILEGENGFVTIRFVVNCHGKPGRFRVEEMGYDYMPKKFNPIIQEKLLSIVKELDEWIPVSNGEEKFDFYQYLTFRLEKGQIKKIMP